MDFLTKNAICYTIRHLFKVAGINLSVDNLIDILPNHLSAKVKFGTKNITFNISSLEVTQQLLAGTLQINKTFTADKVHIIPIILEIHSNFADILGDELHVNADIISLSFIMLSRYEETVIEERDAFGRFEYKNSIAAKYKFIDFPIVDEYAIILRSYLMSFLPNVDFHNNKCVIIPTHDIDEIIRFSGIKKTIRTLLGDIYIYKDFRQLVRSISQLFKSINNPELDPYIASINQFINLSKELGFKSEFYFMGADPSDFDCGYDLRIPVIQNIFNEIKNCNMIVGIHGGFYTLNDPDKLRAEIIKLEDMFFDKIIDVRQHYLRFDVNTTFRTMGQVGLKYDSTLGYAEREGFRCGTCYEYPIYDIKNDIQLNIKERPLIVMDVTLIDYRNLSISEAFEKVNILYSRCKAVGGNFVILWHNTTVTRRTLWYNELYKKFLYNYSN